MNVQKIANKSLTLLVGLALIAACQPAPGLSPANPSLPSNAAQLALPEGGFVCEPLKISLSRTSKLYLQSTGTEALVTLPDCDSTAFVRLQVTGLGIETPIYAVDADELGLLAVEAVCNMSFVLPEIPDGNGRVLSFEAFDSEMQSLDNLSYQVVFNLDSNDLDLSLNCLTTAVARVYDATQELSEALASHLDLDALSIFVGSVLGVGEEPFIFEIDPSFLNVGALAADLVQFDGDLSQLDPQSTLYLQDIGLIQGQIDGLVYEDKIELQLDDPNASTLTGLGNGDWFLPAIEPGDWILTLSEVNGNGTRYTLPEPIPVPVDAQGQVDLGVVHVVPATPGITSLSENPIQVAEILHIQGSDFHSSIQGNQVTLDGADFSRR